MTCGGPVFQLRPKNCVYRSGLTSTEMLHLCTRKLLKFPKLCTQMQHLCTRKKKSLQRCMCFSVNFSKSYRDAKSLQRCTTVQLHSVILRYITVALCKNNHALWWRKFCTVFTLYIIDCTWEVLLLQIGIFVVCRVVASFANQYVHNEQLKHKSMRYNF